MTTTTDTHMDIDRPILDPTATTTTNGDPSSAATTSTTAVDIAAESMELLDTFYRRFFPFKEYSRWLSYGFGPTSSSSPPSDSYLARREFSFTLKNDIYVRFQSFDSIDAFKSELLRALPVKIDIGAVYNVAPKLKKSIAPSSFQPQAKELVLDIDMTDYDDLRTCCMGGSVCRKCWPLMTAAQRVLDAALREDFGFKHILWVFSGRRGIHGWVCDEAARNLSNESRAALVKYLDVVKGQENVARKVYLPHILHPTLQRAYNDVLEPVFVKTVLVNQQILAVQKAKEKVLATVPDPIVAAKIRTEWDEIERTSVRDPTSDDDDDDDNVAEEPSHRDTYRMAQAKWTGFEAILEKASGAKPSGRKSVGGGGAIAAATNTASNRNTQREMGTLARDLMFQFMYPRLDANVSTHINHLLKSPFCVHPKTGKVCVPIDPETCEEFDPTTVPTVVDLVRELDESMELESDVPDWAKTSLKPYMEHFRAFVSGLEAEIRRQARLSHENSFDF